jgi:hypothetical protein
VPDWLKSIIFDAPKHVWKTVERVLISMFTTRATVPLGLMVVLVVLVSKLESKDLKDLLHEVITATWFSVLGWLLFVISIIVGIVAFNWREKIYQRELDRIQEVKNRVVSGQLEIKFPKKETKT